MVPGRVNLAARAWRLVGTLAFAGCGEDGQKRCGVQVGTCAPSDVAVCCGEYCATTCALFDGLDRATTGELRQVPGTCEDFTLVHYAGGVGVTSDGRLVTVDNSADAGRRCTLASEPLGTPVALVNYTCGISGNLWLVTDRMVYRPIWGNGCSCAID